MSQIIVYATHDGAARFVSPGPCIKRAAARCVPRDARHVAVIDDSDLPTDRTHRDAWVWDGQRVVVDPARIKPPPAAGSRRQPPATGETVVMADPRVDALAREMSRQRQEMAKSLGDLFQQMRSEILLQTDIRARRALEAFIVAAALHEQKEISAGLFPALSAMLNHRGQEATPEAIVAAADEIAREQLDAVARAA